MIFFFTSRRRHTRFDCDWSSDVCSSDLVVGEVHPDRITTNAGARPGDALVLTKPIGTGVLTTALKRDLVSEAELAPAVAAMTTLNAAAARAMLAVGGPAPPAATGCRLLCH